MNLERGSERAYHARGPKTAARLYNDIEYELALGEHDNRLESIGEQALALLENSFPGVREAARQIEEPPSLSRRAGDALHGISWTPPQRPEWRRRSERRLLSPRPWSPPCGSALAHPVRAVGMVAVLLIVIVNVWPSIVLGLIALAALRTYGHRGRTRAGWRRR